MMNKKLLFFIVLIISISCNRDDDSSNNTKPVHGRYTHKIPDCVVGGDSIMNCIEFVDFMSNNEVSVLIGGGDIVWTTSYAQNGNKIQIDKKNGFSFEVSFMVENESNLIRIEDNEVWTKSQ